MVANKNIHFITVKGEYFDISPLKTVRYKANENTPAKTNKLPQMLPEPNVDFPFPNINSKAPLAPDKSPKALVSVMGSLMIMAARIILTIGNKVTTIDASMGEVIDKPIINGS